MHVLSKVLLGTVILMAVIAVILTSKLRLARGGWLERIDQRQAQLETLQEELRKKRLAVATARDEVNRISVQWGNAWPGVPGQVANPDLGAVVIGVGANAGLGRREAAAGKTPPNIYAFAQQPQAEGTMFLGELRPTQIQADRTAAQLTREPYQGELQGWPQGQWRIRESIPSSWRSLFAELHARTAEALQDVLDQQARLAKADDLNATSQEQLQRRLAQLDGNPDAIEGSSPIVVDGLVESLRKAQSARNEDLGQLDDLRHEYDRKYRQLLALIETNRQLEDQLPGTGPATTPPETGEDQQALETSAPTTSRR